LNNIKTNHDIFIIVGGNLEVKLPIIRTDKKQKWEELEKRKEEERRLKKIKF